MQIFVYFFLMIRRPPRSTRKESSAASDVYKRQMIELPRAAIKAKDIARHAEFFSFGTNDLTQTTFGISRDDSGKFLNDYIENKIFDIDPFVSIDDGVGDLIKIATDKGRKQNKKIKLGICGEHGGDPKSIEFCAKTGLDYVSCSPYRVPVARLAAAQAQLKKIKFLILNLKLEHYVLIHLLIFYQRLLKQDFLHFLKLFLRRLPFHISLFHI